jgi:hypothetical protein
MNNFSVAMLFVLCLSLLRVDAQNTRVTNRNTIGWYNAFGTFKTSKKTSIHAEYQFRRTELISGAQQGLLRFGINYTLNPKVKIRLGYAWIETFAYGDIPINALGKDFTEHRLFQMITLSDKISQVELSHRFILEQRWIGRYSNANLKREDEFPFSNRLRYMFRVQASLKGKAINDKTPYAAIYNETFIGFGKQVNENIFDQNRLGILLGYRFSPTLRMEIGYLNQILQVGREVNGRNVFQYNNGIVLNTHFNVDLLKKKKI